MDQARRGRYDASTRKYRGFGSVGASCGDFKGAMQPSVSPLGMACLQIRFRPIQASHRISRATEFLESLGSPERDPSRVWYSLVLSAPAPGRAEESEQNGHQIPPPPEVLVKRIARNALALSLAALLVGVALAVIASAQPLDTKYRCNICDPRANQFRSGDFSALSRPIIDPACDCPFPNNRIPRSRLLSNGAWPEDIYRSNTGVFYSANTGAWLPSAIAQGVTPLLEAVRDASRPHPEELERLLEGLPQEEVNARLVNDGFGRTALHYAASRHRGPELIQLLLDSGASVDARDDAGQTPLMVAWWSRRSFKELRAAGADIQAQSDDGSTVLHTAAWSTDAATVEALIAAGLNPNARTDNGFTVLHFAGSPEIFEALRTAGADIHARTDDGYTVLHGAARTTDAATVEALIAAGLDPNAETSDGRTPLLEAGSRETFEALLAGGADLGPIEAVFAPEGLDAVRQGEVSSGVRYLAVRQVGRFASASLVARLRALNPNFADVSSGGSVSPLHRAASSNEDPAMIAALSTSSTTATTGSGAGDPLHLAALSNANPAVIEALLAAGANVHVGDFRYGESGGPTPLYFAAANANPRAAEIVSVLLEAGADVNGRDEQGRDRYAPLYAAAMMQNLTAMEMLIAAGADVNVTGSYDQSLLADVLGRARYDCGYIPVADALRAAGAASWRGSIDSPYVPGPPVVECETVPAEVRSVSAEVQALIDSGADLDAQDGRGLTALLRAAYTSNAVDIAALATAGADVNAATPGRQLTPLHVAIWRRAGLATVQALLAAGADVDAADRLFGATALHRAAGDRRTEPAVAAALLAAGADANARDNFLRTPLDYATRADVNNEAVAALLRAAGGTCRSCAAP